jgi:hypothetical protein
VCYKNPSRDIAAKTQKYAKDVQQFATTSSRFLEYSVTLLQFPRCNVCFYSAGSDDLGDTLRSSYLSQAGMSKYFDIANSRLTLNSIIDGLT